MEKNKMEDKKPCTWWLKTSGAITVFLCVGLGTTLMWFFSTLYPIISQPRISILGKEPELAGPRLSQTQLAEILEKFSIDETLFNLTTAKVEGVDLATGVPIHDLGDMAEVLAPLVESFAYDEAAAFAYDLNKASVENGACNQVSSNQANFGNQGGANDGKAKFECIDMTPTTKENILELFKLRTDHCRTDTLKASTLFEHCLVANALTFSFYVVGGSATFEDNLDCEWTNVQMRDWATIGDDYNDEQIATFSKAFGSRGSTFRAAMEQYKVKCSSGTSRPEIRRENGFIATEETIVEQTWDRSDYYQVKLDCDAEGGNLRSFETWEGDLMIGTLQMISFCKDTSGLDNPKDCFDHFYNSLPPDSVGVEGFTPEDNYAYAVETLEIAWENGISPSDWSDRYEGFQRQCPRGYYPPNVFPPQGVCWNAWRYVFGWGYDTKTVIGDARWNVVGPALYRSGTLPQGTQYSSKQVCSDEDGEVIFEHTTLGNFRTAGTVFEVTPVFRLANVLALVVITVITVSATKLGDNRKKFGILGIVTLVSIGCLWLFETAVNIEHSDMCEMRVSGLFSENSERSSVSVWVSQAFDRISIASVAVAVTQGLFWVANPIVYNTGEMPSFVSGCIVSAGLLYAIFVGAYGIISTNACAAYYGLHDMDIFLPFLISIFLLPLTLYGLLRAPADLMLVKYGLEKPMDIDGKKALYKKPRKLHLTDPRFGLKLFGHIIKKGIVMLTVNGIVIEEETRSLVENQGSSWYTGSSSRSILEGAAKESIPEENADEVEADIVLDDVASETDIDDNAKGLEEKEEPSQPDEEKSYTEPDDIEADTKIDDNAKGLEEKEEPSMRYKSSRSTSRMQNGFSQRSLSSLIPITQRSLHSLNSIMIANDNKLEGSVIGKKLAESEEFEHDAWFVYLIKLVFEKDGIA